ncbi:MAG TPA: cation diffusion facilitator family transporter [Candidatus Limnocylindrales bacterium]|nr:cation diffusion facilitator family transporter [Candidatus Limnocylindrales bacterium]
MSDIPRAHQHETSAPHGPDHPHDHGPDADHVHAPHDHDVEGGHAHGDSQSGAAHGHEHPTGRVASLVASVVGHSHDPADSLDDALAGDRRGIRAVQISLVGLGITAVLQLGIVAISGSVALLADTVHNFSDALTAVPLWIAFAIGGRAATRTYTFGFRRAEDLAGLFVLVMILLSAIFAGWESITRLIDPQPISNIPAVMIAGIVGFLGNEAVALYRLRVGRQIGSAALVADGYHARTDGLTSLAVVAGAIGVVLGFPRADPIVGLLISFVILVVLRSATAQMVGRLMDAVQPEMVDEVERITRETPGVVDVEKVRLRWVGHALETNLSITVDQDLTVMGGHAISEEVRHRLLHQVSKLDTVVIHVNPCDHSGVDPHQVVRHHEAARGG